jgi:hypothetical protein
MLKLGDGTHLHLETTKQKGEKMKKRRSQSSPLPRLGNGTPLVPIRKENQKKDEEGELKFPFCLNLAMVPQKQQKK